MIALEQSEKKRERTDRQKYNNIQTKIVNAIYMHLYFARNRQSRKQARAR